MKKNIFFILLLAITVVTYAQEKGNIEGKSPSKHLLNTPLKSTENKNLNKQQSQIASKLAEIRAIKIRRVNSKKTKKIVLKSNIKLKKKLLKKELIAKKTEKKDKILLEKALAIRQKEENKKIKTNTKITKTIALKAELKQHKKLTKEQLIAEKLEKRDEKLLKKALIISQKIESKRLKINTKIAKSSFKKSELIQKKKLLEKEFVTEKMMKKARKQLEITLVKSEKEAFRKRKFSIQKEIALALVLQLKLINELKENYFTKKRIQRFQNQSKITQIIFTKEMAKRARFKAKKAKILAYDGEVVKVYR